MKLRDLTTAESFPLAYQQDLLKIQSEHFVNKIITTGNFEIGYENMPVDFPSAPDNLPIILNSKPPQLLILTYLKNNWMPLLAFGIVVAGSVTLYYKLKQKKEKKSGETKNPKTIYYNLPKKSI